MKSRLQFISQTLRKIANSNLRRTNKKIKKNILFIGPGSFQPGIWQNRVKYVFRDLFEAIEADANIYMLTGCVPEFAKAGIRDLELKFGITFFELGADDKSKNNRDWIKQGVAVAKKVKADVITNVFGSVQFPNRVVKIAKKVGAQAIVRVAGDEISSRISLGRYQQGDFVHQEDQRIQEQAFSGADKIIAMSPWERERIVGICLAPEKVSICYRGVNLKEFDGARLKEPSEATRFLYVGRKSAEKGFQLVERVAISLEKRYPNIVFSFAGDFKKQVIGNRRYLGFVATEKLPDLYRRSDVVMLCSETEGMPQVLIEAMAMATPCILSEDLFYKWLVEENVALFSNLSVEDTVTSVLAYYEKTDLVRNHGINARGFAERRFSREKGQSIYRTLLLES